ncbi:hypothetical protein D3C87_1912610 [compost metagenome]
MSVFRQTERELNSSAQLLLLNVSEVSNAPARGASSRHYLISDEDVFVILNQAETRDRKLVFNLHAFRD